jgi:hypothetical protein
MNQQEILKIKLIPTKMKEIISIPVVAVKKMNKKEFVSREKK